MERADALPLRRVGFEIGRRRLRARATNLVEPARIVRQQRGMSVIGDSGKNLCKPCRVTSIGKACTGSFRNRR